MEMQLKGGLSKALNAKIIGSGNEAIVLAHGFGTDQSIWDKIVPYLARRYSVLVFDWSFSGAITDPNLFDKVKYSSYEAFADDLISLMDEMNLRSSVFIGHSMSGMIGCIASIKSPELFKRLILVGVSPRYMNSEDYYGGFTNSDIGQILSKIETNYYEWASGFASLSVDANDPPSVQKYRNCLQRMKPDVAFSLSRTVFFVDERDILDKVTVPCTIIQTTNDPAVPQVVAEYMQRKLKGESTLEIVEAVGHFPQLTAHVHFLDVLGKVMGCSFK